MKKIIMYAGVVALGALVSGTAIAANTSADVTANIVYKIGSKTYNGTTSGVINISPTPSPTPGPTPVPVADSITFEIPSGWSGDSSGVLGASGILYRVSGTSVTFTCPAAYPNIVSGITSTNPQNGLAHVGGSAQNIAVGNLKKINTPTDGDIEIAKTTQKYQNRWTNSDESQERTRVICVPVTSDWTIQ